MKTLMTIATLIVIAFALATPAFATSVSTSALPVAASVDGGLSISATLFKDSTSGPVGNAISSINFGQLQVFSNTSTGGQTLRSSDTGTGALMGGVVALVSANSHGAHYTISQTGTALTSGTNTIPAGACRMVPFYSASELSNGVAQGAIPAGASVGTAASWVTSTGNTVYNSESSAAAMRIVQAHFGITDDPASGATAAVPITQAPGTNYSGSVTFTVVSP